MVGTPAGCEVVGLVRPCPPKSLKEMLVLGKSRPWKEAMMKMTGQPEMSTKAIREYFEPLEKWLEEQNSAAGVSVGWGATDVSRLCGGGEVAVTAGNKS